MSTSTTPDLVPDRAEITRRVAAVARQAADRGLDALVIVEPANVYYLSGFRTTLHTRFTAVAVRTADPDRATLVAPSVDRKLAREPVWFPSLLARTEIYYEGAPDGGQLANAPGPLLDAVLRDGDAVGVDLAGASYGQVQLLTARYPAMRLADATEILHDARRVKSAFELAALRRANAIAVEVLGGVPALLREGMTEVDLALALDGAARQAGADGFAYPTLVGFGPKSLAPHAPPTPRRLRRDRIVTIAFGPTVAGYCADIVRTFFYGDAPAVAVESGERTVEVQAAALAAVRAGRRAGDLMVAAREVIARHYPAAPAAGRAGHSLGLTIHETPSLTADNDLHLATDMVLAIEPGTPGSAMEGIGLYRHCDVVRVTDEGYELLTPLARGLQVVPT
ncbi:MAG TPA: Xaa-Pro peptidase family protein [Thermomicrobiales bacterium]|nr:Xaa-Pro peptidase family protein [Thermomicrobiales bacterium]